MTNRQENDRQDEAAADELAKKNQVSWLVREAALVVEPLGTAGTSI